VVVIQHSHSDLYDLLKLVPRYLADLEIHYLRQEEEREAQRFGTGDGESEPPRKRLPPALEPFSERASLRTLFTLFADEDEASFRYLTPTELRSYITLTGHAVAETAPKPAPSRQSFEPELIQIPAGEFLMGSTEEEVQQGLAEKNETPQHPVDLPAYAIGRYPVTNLEYKAFVETAGHAPPKHWSGGEFPADLADHPVVYVSWHDAVAYCQWLSQATGQIYRLPTEAEWEKAAAWAEVQVSGGAGGQKLRYPWGNAFDQNKCNTKEADLGITTPVGQFSPEGDSPYGCADMAGNVWEWCSTIFEDYPFQVQDEWTAEYLKKKGYRVLRGGAFGSLASAARSARRNRNYPYNDSLRYYGFRVVGVAASSSTPLASDSSGH
jgi:formylglycine-generating enzyme required for sulfatase activity